MDSYRTRAPSRPLSATAATSRRSSRSTRMPTRRAASVQPGGCLAHGASPSHGQSRSEDDLHVSHRAAEPHNPHVHAPSHAVDERFQQEVGQTCGPRTACTSPITISAAFTRRCALPPRWKRESRRACGRWRIY
jgi:hypothetical protein